MLSPVELNETQEGGNMQNKNRGRSNAMWAMQMENASDRLAGIMLDVRTGQR